MPTTEFGNSLRDCEKKIKNPSKKSFGKDVALIMRSMGIRNCRSGSTSACIKSQVGWGAASGSICGGTEDAVGCEQLMANFNKTRIVKEALTCAINNRMQETTTLSNQVNKIKVKVKDSECCTCGAWCRDMNDDGTVASSFLCKAVGDINQSNAADIKTFSQFSSDEAEDVKDTILKAVKDDIKLVADTKKEGLGADSGQKVITGNEIESITKTSKKSVSENIQKTLNQLSQKNIAEYDLDGVKSPGPCIGNVDQSNVIKLVVETVMSQTLESIRESVDESTYEKILDVVASKDVTGLDVGKDPPMGGIGSMFAVVALAAIGAGVYMTMRKGGIGGEPGSESEKIVKDIIEAATGNDPKAKLLAVSFILTLVLLFFMWFILSIMAFWRSLKSGFGLF